MKYFLTLLSLSFLSGCLATETGNPIQPIVDGSKIMGEGGVGPATIPPKPPFFMVYSGPGTVMPAEGNVFAWVVQNDLPPTMGAVNADGSFSLEVTGEPSAGIRLHVRNGEALSDAIDLESNGITLSIKPDLTCLSLSTGKGVLVDDLQTIEVRNDCEVPVVRSNARLREDSAGFSLVDDGKLTLAPSEVSTLNIDGGNPGAMDLVVFSLSAPEERVVAITVFRE